MSVWELHFRCVDPDEESWQLLEAGAMGVEILGPHELRTFFSGSSAELERFRAAARSLGFVPLRSAVLDERNWVQECEELMEPVTVGRLRVIPIADASRSPEKPDRMHIALIPGAGFGTGHHISTELALRLLQNKSIQEMNPRKIFDLGTGSGILSIAAAALFSAEVDAVDVEPMALENAAENCLMNHSQSSIRLMRGSIEHASGEYDLIMSNLYAELLCSYAARLHHHLRNGGVVLLSGILASFRENILSSFAAPAWREIERAEELGWCAFLFKKDRSE